MTRYVDILVVGAGPGGAAAAALLAHARPDWSLLVADQRSEPRSQACGEFLSPDGLRILQRCGWEDALPGIEAQRLTGLDLWAPDGRLGDDYRPLFGRAPYRPHGIGVRREALARLMWEGLRNAGVALQLGWSLRDLQSSGEEWVCWFRDGAKQEHSIRARVVVGADGRRSRVRRLSGRDRPLPQRRFALAARLRGVVPMDGRRRGEMHLGQLGQIGLAPVSADEWMANLIAGPALPRLLRRSPPRHILRQALRSTPTLHQRTREAVISGPVHATPCLPHAATSVGGQGIMLVGDAAGFRDPFTGEGMCLALQSAELLADSLAAHGLAMGQPAYERRWRRRILPQHRMETALQVLLRHRRSAQWLTAMIGRSRLLSHLLVGMTGNYHNIPRRVPRDEPPAQPLLST